MQTMRQIFVPLDNISLSEPVESDTSQNVPQWLLLPDGHPDYIRLILTSRVYDVVSETPLAPATILADRLQRKVLLKREDLHPIFGFELRGAYNKIAHLDLQHRWKGIVAYSSGNHAEGVAFSARHLGIPASIVMPIHTPEFKCNNVSRFGASVVLAGTDSVASMEEALRLEQLHGVALVPPLDDPYIIAGQGTIGMEILRQTDPQTLEAVFCAIPNGALIAGVGVYIKRVAPHVKIIGVGSFGTESFANASVCRDQKRTRAYDVWSNGARAHNTGKETFRLCRKVVDEVVLVTHDDIHAAVKDMYEETRVIVEPEGALALAGLQSWTKRNPCQQHGRDLVAITSGANTAFDSLVSISPCMIHKESAHEVHNEVHLKYGP